MSAVLEAQEPSAKYLESGHPPVLHQFELLANAPGGVARLRNLILTLAIQGKLVPQNSSDEPALQLLETIAAEKDRQIASERIKDDKPLMAPLDQCPFEIPETWAWVPMGEVVEIVRGITFPASEKTKEAAPGRIACLRTANIQEAIEWDDLLFVSRSFMGRDDQLLRPHDIVMSMANSRELVGKVALVDHIPHPESTFGGFLGVLRPWKIDPRYAMALLRSSYARSSLIDSASQTTNIANISLGKLRPLPFPLPPLAEQARIVARVDELMRLCDAFEAKGRLEAEQHARLLSTLLGTLTDSSTPEELAANWQRVAEHFDLLLDRPEVVDALEQTILQLAVRGLLVQQDPNDEPASVLLKRISAEKGRLIAEGQAKREKALPPIMPEEEAFELPAGWAWTRWNDIALKIGDIDHRMPDETPDGVPYVSPRDFWGANEIDFEGAKKIAQKDFKELSAKIQPTKGDLIYPRYGTIGNVRMVTTDQAFLASYSCAVIKVLHGYIDARFQYLVSISEHIRQQARGATNRTTQPNVGLKSIQQFVFPLPPLAEQARIVGRVTELRRLCSDLRHRLERSSATQAALADTLVEQSLVA